MKSNEFKVQYAPRCFSFYYYFMFACGAMPRRLFTRICLFPNDVKAGRKSQEGGRVRLNAV